MSLKPESLLPKSVADAMTDEAVGRRLKALREAMDLSPSEMADTLGIERTYWTRYEKGRQGLSDSVAALLVLRFSVTLDFLIMGDDSKLPVSIFEKIRSKLSE
ncbi:helix-turn-helix domain-containing protein [Sulfitobacter sp. 20_GPM-1509m]|uniref:helix-turn-helix domain-containing protein n=1 Tax=Sulfitobacter sp. 20_GPM-1509m TaxID=1380367 RepID=UPI00048C6E77|nr:helix-turn-helix transcriptional regulator [Sulfitobacter sp. 20_GPM-1509m]